MLGLVIRCTGSWHVVRTDDGRLFRCKVRGNFRLRGMHSTNPVAVGDHVELQPSTDGTALITELCDRRNYIVRKPSNLSKQSHVIAANLDQVLLMATVAHPETSTTFIDRFLATAEAYRIPTLIVFNKTDLYDGDETQYMQALIQLYRSIGYECHAISALAPTAPPDLVHSLQGKTTLLSGNSGVGKSTLLNTLSPNVRAKTADISAAHDRGMHTTTLSEMFDLPFGGSIIDTPGIKGFGTYDMKKEEISHYFRDIFTIGADCRFHNCTHTCEPDCAVLRALQESRLALTRYNSYLSMLQGDDKYRGKDYDKKV